MYTFNFPENIQTEADRLRFIQSIDNQLPGDGAIPIPKMPGQFGVPASKLDLAPKFATTRFTIRDILEDNGVNTSAYQNLF